jgi:NAD(P)-dependent dehydrogenase (short-subunit alcohol dehydrogenase family)
MTKRALITGITGNLGKAADKVFKAKGWETVGVSRGTGTNLSVWHHAAILVSDHNPFDLVFMTHGLQIPCELEEMSEWEISEVIENNLTSSFNLTALLARDQKIKPGGLIVYCSSIQATQPRRGRGAYAVAKAGLEALTKIAAVEMAPAGRAICLRLGQMTGTMKGVEFSPEAVAEIGKNTPLPWVSFVDTAKLVLALYEQPSLSGEVIEVSSMHKFSIWP